MHPSANVGFDKAMTGFMNIPENSNRIKLVNLCRKIPIGDTGDPFKDLP